MRTKCESTQDWTEVQKDEDETYSSPAKTPLSNLSAPVEVERRKGRKLKTPF
jgi:hypothetical protein